MKDPRRILSGAVAAASVLFAANSVQAQTLYSNSMDSSAGWQIYPVGGNDSATFGFNYSTLGIPSAPHSGDGSTLGLRLNANAPIGAGSFSGISVSPAGLNVTGDYMLRFDMWINYPVPGPGSTQLTGAGLLTAGAGAQWPGATADSIFFASTGDGGSGGAAPADFRIYAPGVNNAAASTGYYTAGTDVSAKDNLNAYYSNFGNQPVPAAQASVEATQTGSSPVGALGFAWHDVGITKIGNVVTWDIDGKRIATVDTSSMTGFGGGNIELLQSDINATQTDGSGSALLFGLFDNVQVVSVPEPSTIALMGLAGAALIAPRRRRK